MLSPCAALVLDPAHPSGVCGEGRGDSLEFPVRSFSLPVDDDLMCQSSRRLGPSVQYAAKALPADGSVRECATARYGEGVFAVDDAHRVDVRQLRAECGCYVNRRDKVCIYLVDFVFGQT